MSRVERPNRPEKQYFGSPDVFAVPLKSGRKVVIPPNAERLVPIIIEDYHFPGPGRPNPFVSADMKESACSARAQRGGFVKEGEAEKKHKEYMERKARGMWGSYVTEIAVYNRSTQQMEINGRLCSFFTEGPELRGERLVDSIGRRGNPDESDRPIQISGVPGEDWKLIYDNGHNDKSTVAGVYLKIDLKNRLWIPQQPKQKIVLPEDFTARKYPIEEISTSAPKTHDNILWVAKTTAELHLPSNVHGILGKAVVSNVRKVELDQLYQEAPQTQENSRHLKGRGLTKWQIYVEVYGPTVEEESAHYVPVFFFEE